MIKLNSISWVLILIGGCGFSSPVLSADYWVTKEGNDSNLCTSSSPCLSIQKGLSLLKKGDTLNIGAGTYIEDSTSSPFTDRCRWLDGIPTASLCMNSSGTKDEPIVIQAAPGAEGMVVIDSQGTRLGLHIQSHDYILINSLSFQNNYVSGIATWGQPENRIADEDRLSIGVTIANCFIYNTNGPAGKNIAGIHMWGSKDWIVSNNTIDLVMKEGVVGSHTSGIQAYGTIDALVTHNELNRVGSGVLWKDHFVADALGNPVFESEIAYNRIAAAQIGINIVAMGAGTDEAGVNYIHHNIIYGYSEAGILANISHARGISKGLFVAHNVLDGRGNRNAIGVSNDGFIDHYMWGNILVGNKVNLLLMKEKDVVKPELIASEFNVFGAASSSPMVADRYATSQCNYANLVNWQDNACSLLPSTRNELFLIESGGNLGTTRINAAILPSAMRGTEQKHDLRSTEASVGEIFVDRENHNYHLAASSPAIFDDGYGGEFVAGPYEVGTEVIGVVGGAFDWVIIAPAKMLVSLE